MIVSSGWVLFIMAGTFLSLGYIGVPVPFALGANGDPGGVAEGRFGPDAILMVGFTAEETTRWRAELDDIEAEFVKLVTCTTAMASGPRWSSARRSPATSLAISASCAICLALPTPCAGCFSAASAA